MIRRSLVAFFVLTGVLVAPGAPATASERIARGCHETAGGYTCFYGPYEVGPAGNEIAKLVSAPDEAGYITFARTTLVNRRNEPLSRHMVHLHHAVWVNPVAEDLTCSNPFGERFFASGKERTPMDLPAGHGYFWSNEAAPNAWPYFGAKGWGMTAHLDGMHGMTHDGVFIRLRMRFVPASEEQLIPTRALWLDVNGSCTTNPTFDVVKGSGTDGRYKKNATMDMPVSGELIGMAGHLHDGGLRLTLRNQTTQEKVFTSRALYEDSRRWFLTGMTSFYEVPGRTLTAGDDLELTAVYDSTHNWNDVMGIMLGALVVDE